MKSQKFIFAFLLLANCILFANPNSFFNVHSFKPKDYDADSQNWAIIQDRKGLIYVANNSGILQYDGSVWRLIEAPNKTTVRSLAITEDGTIWYGAKGEIGYLKPDNTSTYRAKSLLDKVDPNYRNFSDVWQIYTLDNEVLFRTRRTIYIYKNGKFDYIQTKEGFLGVFSVGNKVFVVGASGIFYELRDKILIPLNNGSAMGDTRVCAILDYGKDRYLVVSETKGLFLLENNQLTKFQTKIDNQFFSNSVYKAVKLSNGNFAFATLSKGLFVAENNFAGIRYFTTDEKIADNFTLSLFEDNSKGLWVGTSNGISRITFGDHLTLFNGNNGIKGSITGIYKEHNQFYLSTDLSILKGLIDKEGAYKFRSLLPENIQVWKIVKFLDKIYAATNRGIYRIDENKTVLVFQSNEAVFSLYPSKIDKNRLWVGFKSGLGSVYSAGNGLVLEKKYDDIDGEVRTIEEDVHGNVFVSSIPNRIFKVNPFAAKGKQVVDLKNNISNNSLKNVNILNIDNKIYLSIDNGLYVFNYRDNKFQYDNKLNSAFGSDKKWIYDYSEYNGSFYFVGEPVNKIKDAYKRTDIWKYSIPHSSETEFSQFRIIPEDVNAVFADDNGEVWFGGNELLVAYNPNIHYQNTSKPNALIRKISIGNDSLIYGGDDDPQKKIVLNYGNSPLKIEFAATGYDFEKSNLYQYKLEGMSDQWSNWTKESYVLFSNLAEGNYKLKVRAKDVYGNISNTAEIQIKILPPFYRSWWAYVIYVILLAISIKMLVRHRSKKLVAENEKLERIVKVRTNELYQKNIEIENKNLLLNEQTTKLKELDELKSNFFTNISHELRTPLTLILGPIESLIAKSRELELIKQYTVIQNNAKRLLNLINELLDISKIESGKMKLHYSSNDVNAVIKNVYESFEPAFEKKKIVASLDLDNNKIYFDFDREKVEKIIINLLSNALKFTQENGIIKVTTQYFENECKISVSDSGLGISSDNLKYVFDKFYQVEGDKENTVGGTGVGLALCRELVNLHSGTIDVKSELGEGSEFTIILPMKNITDKASENADNSNNSNTFIDFEESANFEDAENAKTHLNTILIVEDNPDMRNYIANELKNDYNILIAADGQEGLEKAMQIIPDLIVSDVIMPKLDGMDMLKTLKKDINTSHIPIVLLTAKSESESKISGLEIGADDYLTKPFSEKELKIRIKNLLNNREVLRIKYSKNIVVNPTEINVESVEEAFLINAVKIVEKHMQDFDFDVDVFCHEIGMSRTNLHRKLKALVNKSATAFIRSVRLKRAEQLINKNAGNISEIAFQVGFNNLSYFSECFKKEFGVLPSEYK